jgi:hypothetical protein
MSQNFEVGKKYIVLQPFHHWGKGNIIEVDSIRGGDAYFRCEIVATKRRLVDGSIKELDEPSDRDLRKLLKPGISVVTFRDKTLGNALLISDTFFSVSLQMQSSIDGYNSCLKYDSVHTDAFDIFSIHEIEAKHKDKSWNGKWPVGKLIWSRENEHNKIKELEAEILAKQKELNELKEKFS